MKTLKLFPLFFLLTFAAFSQVSIGIYPLATASGTDTYTATVSPAPSAYVSGQRFNIKFTNANTGAATININSLGAKSIVKHGTSPLVAGDISAGQAALLQYDGTNMQMVGGSSLKGYGLVCSDLVTELAAGTNKAFIAVPAGFTITSVYAYVLTAQTSGTTLTIDIHESGTTILSTKLTIDNNETTSTTAATPYVLSDASIAANGRLTVDIDDAGTGGYGLMVWIYGY